MERIIRFAFEVARGRAKKHLTVVTKSNAQRNGMVMWDAIAAEVGKEFPDVEVDKMLVDAMTVRMVLKPESLDTIVATNLVSVLFCLVLVLVFRGVCVNEFYLACGYLVGSRSCTCRVYWHCTNQ